jgi:hypothetical protein
MTADIEHRIFVLRYADRVSQRQHHFYGAIDRPYEAFDEARRLASDPALVIPGHDPAVLERFPASRISSLRGHAAVIG